MKKLQEAAKLLNANAPVDGPLGKERIVYVNPLEEEVLKALGGSGEIIIPEEDTPSYSQTRVLPEGYSGITSKRVDTSKIPKAKKARNWWEEFKDDVLGFDDTKWLGIKKKTFVGKGLKKIGDDILGIDGSKTLGIKDSTIGDVAKFVAPFFGPIGWAAWAGMNAYEVNEALENADKYQDALAKHGSDFTNNYDPRNYIGLRYGGLDGLVDYLGQGSGSGLVGIPKTTPQERAEKRGSSAMQAIKNRINSVPSYSLFNDSGNRQWGEDGTATNTAIAVDMQSKGKAPIFDVNDASKTTSFFASPGDPDYQPGFSMGGQYNDPYPNYMRPVGNQIISGINEAATYLPDYAGTVDQRMYDFQPILDRLKGMNLDAIGAIGQIYDQDGITKTFQGYNQQQDNLSNQLKQLNLNTGYDNQANLNNYINALGGVGDAYKGVSGAYNNVSGAYQNQGNMMSNAYMNRGNMMQDAYNNYGSMMGNAYTNRGNMIGDAYANRGNQMFDAYSNRGNQMLNSYLNQGNVMQNAYNNQGSQLFDAYGNRGSTMSQLYGDRGQTLNNLYGQRSSQLMGGAQGIADAYGGVGDAFTNVGNVYGQSADSIRNYGDALGSSVDEKVALTNRAFDAERGRALAQNRQGLNMANQSLRNLNSLNTSGTGSSMASAMINARLGQDMANNIAGVEADRYRRLAEINPAMADVLRSEQYSRAIDRDIAGAQQGVSAAQQGVAGAQSLLQGTDAASNALVQGGDALTQSAIKGGDLSTNSLIQGTDRLTDSAIRGSKALTDAGIQGTDINTSSLIKGTDDLTDAGIRSADLVSTAGINAADQVGRAGINASDKFTEAGINSADQLGTAGVNAANQGVNAQNALVKAATQDALGAETRFNQGNQVNKAVAANIGIDKGMVDSDSQLTSDIMNTMIQNLSLIPYLGQQAAQLPGIQVEAGLSPMNPIMQYSAPFTQMGSMPSPVTGYQPQPAESGMEWYDYAMRAPQIIGGVNDAIDEFGNFIGRF